MAHNARQEAKSQLEGLARGRILVLDGAMGTMIQQLGLDEAAYHVREINLAAARCARRAVEALATNEDLIAEKYRGIRPAPGHPACPDHTEKWTLFRLLDAERNTGIRLTENLAMTPAASVCGLYFAHPQARYFSVDRITRD